MPYVFQLLNSKGISKTVLHVVMEMIYNLVSVEMTEEEETEYQLEEVKGNKEEEEEWEEKKEQDLSKEILVLNGCPKYSHNKQGLFHFCSSLISTFALITIAFHLIVTLQYEVVYDRSLVFNKFFVPF